MKILKKVLIILMVLIIPQAVISAPLKIVPGIIIDDINEKTKPILSDLEKELKALLSDKVDIKKRYILSSEWSLKKSRENYNFLLKEKDVNLIITIGVLSSGIAAEYSVYKKPVMAVGIVDPEVQNLKPTKNNRSDIDNLTYILFNKSLERDLKRFYEIYPYKKVGIVADENIIDAVIKNNEPIKRTIDKYSADFGIIPVNKGINGVLEKIKDYDAVYLGYFGRFEGEEKKSLIDSLAKLKIPAFGSSIEDIKYGALAAVSPEESMIKIIRRISLNVESLLEGKNFSTLPVNLKFEEKLTINMEAAKKIGFSPKFAVLSKADVVNDLDDSSKNKLSLKDVVFIALKNNIDLNLSGLDIDIADKDMKVAKSGYYPSVSLNGTGTIIDDERAKASMGSQAARTTSGSLKLEQLIYSEELSSGVEVQRKTYDSKKESYNAKRLDTINNAAKAFFDVLKAKTLTKIRKDNLELTKKHLSISKQREAVGYSGKSDIYRWESSLASVTTELFESMNNYRLSKMSLNRILNRSINKPISIMDESIDGELFKHYISGKGYKYIDNPAGFKKLADFLVKESKLFSPELKELELLRKAYKREYKRYKRERYIPTASLAGEAQHVFSRGGEGSDVSGVDPEDDQWTIALNFSWAIFTGGSKKINLDKTELSIKKIENQIKKVRQNLELNTRSAVLNAVNKIVNLESSKTSADFAKKSLVLIQDSYARGKVSITELINAQNDSLSADLSYMNSVYDFLSAVFELERATGQFTLFSDEKDNLKFMNRMNDYMTK